MPRIGIRELKNGLSLYLRRVADGEWIEVTRRGKVIARIVPVDEGQREKPLLALIEAGAAAWSGGKPEGSPCLIRSRGQPLAQVILDDRR